MPKSTLEDFHALFAPDEEGGTIDELLEDLIEMEALEDEALGVAKQALDPEEGIESLSLQQCRALYAGIAAYDDRLLQRTCQRCGNDIAWGYRLLAVDEGCWCSHCVAYDRHNA